MGILLVVGTASYGKMNERAKVEQAAITVSTQLRTWQKQVESGVGSSVCAGGVFGGIRVRYDTDYIINARVMCDGVQAGDWLTLPIPNGCTVNNFGSFIIKPVGQGFSATPAITISNPRDNSLAYSVLLSLSGGIDVAKKSP